MMIDASMVELFQSLPKRVIATIHRDPEVDAIGSMLGLGNLIQRLGGTVDLYSPDIHASSFDFLPGVHAIQKQVHGEYDMAIFLDCSNAQRIHNPPSFPMHTTCVNIDHHSDNHRFGHHNLVLDVSSVGEIMVALFNALDVPIDIDTGTNLYAAICSDTGGFRFANTSAQTLNVAANLATMGVPIHSVMDQLFESKPMAYFSMIQSGLDHWYIDPHYPFGIVTIPYGLEGKSPNSPIDFFRQLTDTELMVLCKEILPNEFKISFRSRSTLNVAQLAHQFNGGGGHIRASGTRFVGDHDTLHQSLIRVIYEAFS